MPLENRRRNTTGRIIHMFAKIGILLASAAASLPAFQKDLAPIPHRLPLRSDTIASALENPILAGIVKIPPGGIKPPQGDTSYDELDCSDSDKEKIGYILTTMAANGKLTLLLTYKKDLEKAGNEIGHVHPLKFLGVTFSNPKLSQAMKEIRHDYFKWRGFADGIKPSLTNQATQNKLLPYLDDFSKEINRPAARIKPFLENKDWDGMLDFLLDSIPSAE